MNRMKKEAVRVVAASMPPEDIAGLEALFKVGRCGAGALAPQLSSAAAARAGAAPTLGALVAVLPACLTARLVPVPLPGHRRRQERVHQRGGAAGGAEGSERAVAEKGGGRAFAHQLHLLRLNPPAVVTGPWGRGGAAFLPAQSRARCCSLGAVLKRGGKGGQPCLCEVARRTWRRCWPWWMATPAVRWTTRSLWPPR